ncbi:hypothetical protein C8R11_1351, partial [Nitrosomonas aestuarii]
MKNIQLIGLVVCLLALALLSGCFNDGDGQLELKETRKELSDLPPAKRWSVTDAFP